MSKMLLRKLSTGVVPSRPPKMNSLHLTIYYRSLVSKPYKQLPNKWTRGPDADVDRTKIGRYILAGGKRQSEFDGLVPPIKHTDLKSKFKTSGGRWPTIIDVLGESLNWIGSSHVLLPTRSVLVEEDGQHILTQVFHEYFDAAVKKAKTTNSFGYLVPITLPGRMFGGGPGHLFVFQIDSTINPVTNLRNMFIVDPNPAEKDQAFLQTILQIGQNVRDVVEKVEQMNQIHCGDIDDPSRQEDRYHQEYANLSECVLISSKNVNGLLAGKKLVKIRANVSNLGSWWKCLGKKTQGIPLKKIYQNYCK